jgi:hypothetical protein
LMLLITPAFQRMFPSTLHAHSKLHGTSHAFSRVFLMSTTIFYSMQLLLLPLFLLGQWSIPTSHLCLWIAVTTAIALGQATAQFPPSSALCVDAVWWLSGKASCLARVCTRVGVPARANFVWSLEDISGISTG